MRELLMSVLFVLTLSAQTGTRPEPPQSQPAKAAPVPATIKGRCVDETGQPLAGVRAKLDSWGRNQSDQALHAGEAAKDPEPVTSDADGRFVFAVAPHGGSQYSLDLRAEGRVPRTGRWSGLEPAQVEDLGDIVLARGHTVRGRVVDGQGQPVSGAAVALKNLPLPIRADMGANNVRYGGSKADGAFVVEVPIPAGTWSLDVEGRGLKLVRPDSVLVRKDKGADDLTVVVRRMPSIRGVVVDDVGQPVAGVYLQAETRARSGRMAAGYSRKDGTFEIFAVDDEPEPTGLQVVDAGRHEPPAADPARYEWGTKDIKIVVRRGLTRELLVVAADTGAPVEEFALQCHGPQVLSSRESEIRLGGRHPGGTVTIDRVVAGENLLRVFPKDPSLVQEEVVKFTMDGPVTGVLRVALTRRAAIVAQVVDAAGVPVGGSRVELIDPRGETVDATAYVPEPQHVFSSAGEYTGKRVISFAVTDAEGRATVYALPAAKGLVLRATGPGHVPLLAGEVAPGGDQPKRVQVVRGGVIHGTVTPGTVAVFNLTVQPAGEAPARRAPRGAGAVGADGRFQLTALPPGEHEIEAVAQLWFRHASGASGQTVVLRGARTKVLVADGKVVPVELDLRAYAPATVEGIVTLDGQRPESARVVLRGRSADGQWAAGQFVPDDKGRFVATGLLPGTYTPELVIGDLRVNEGSALKLADVEIELKPGERVLKELAFKK